MHSFLSIFYCYSLSTFEEEIRSFSEQDQVHHTNCTVKLNKPNSQSRESQEGISTTSLCQYANDHLNSMNRISQEDSMTRWNDLAWRPLGAT